MRRVEFIILLALGMALFAGCGKSDDSANAPAPAAQPAAESEITPHVMELGPLAQLVPGRQTHIAIDSTGSIYWSQESPDGRDTVFRIGDDDISQPTSLTSSAILSATSPSPQSGSGSIQSLAIAPDDTLLFFFSGGGNKAIDARLGQYDPRTQAVRILADTAALATAAHMGQAIALARGQIIRPLQASAPGQARMWLWLHDPDAGALLRFQPQLAGIGAVIDPISILRQLSGDASLPALSADTLDFAPGQNDSLLLMDRHNAMLWRVDASGAATRWTTLIGLPRQLSIPTARPGGIALAFAPAGELAIGTDTADEAVKDAHYLHIQWPALLAFTADQIVPVVLREDMSSTGRVNLTTLQLQQLLPAGQPHEWIGYDQSSGVLMRAKISPKE